ncbi:MAG: 50S ribosomal protein L19 [Pseudomonadota bacterium]
MSGEVPQIDAIEKKQLRSSKIDDFRPGDTVRVHYEIVEGEKKRVQVFQGVIIRVKGRKTLHNRSNFTVRKVSYQVGVERTFLYNSPRLLKVEVVTPGKVRQSRLYYMRQRSGKSARIQERIDSPHQAQEPPPAETTENAEAEAE